MGADRTFLFTDIEGSTRKWEDHPSLMAAALARHDELMTDAVASYAGVIVTHTGDGMLAVFDSAVDALRAASAAQRALSVVEPNSIEPLKVRMGVHRGAAVEVGGNYFGPTLNRCARMMAVAHGGQVVLSDDVTAAPDVEAAGEELSFVDLGSHQLRDVPNPVPVLQLVVPGLPSEFPPLRTAGQKQHNLPGPVSTFIGRVKVLEAVDDLLDSRRLVTIVGSGGCGKTRVAIEAAAARVAQHRDGAWLVELADLPSGHAVGSAVAAVLRVQEETGRPIGDTLAERLSHSDLLLVLDNCEHVIAEVAELSARLLEVCPDVQVLATSRAPIGIPGEALLAIEPLELPGAVGGEEAEAVRLFLDRAVLVRPDFSAASGDLATVARICRRLDGIPLAIELAAARLNVLSLAQLETRLDQRFALLTGTSFRSARQRTLLATVEWSYELLADAEQRAWCALSVFIGGFDLEAAAFLLDVDELEAVDLLSALVDRSIVQASPRPDGVRYRMLETMREFGRERLEATGALDAARARHRAWLLDLAARAEPEHMTSVGPAWHKRFDLEFPNIRLAIESGLEDGAADESLQLCADLGIYFWLRGHLAQGREWAEQALTAAGTTDPRLRARGHLTRGELALGQLDFESSAPELEEAVELATSVDDQPTIGWAQMFLAVVYAGRGEVDKAIVARDEALRVAERYVIPSVTAGAYYWVGSVNATIGDNEGAELYLTRAVDLAREVGSPYTLARFLPLIARRLHAVGNHDEAIRVFEEAIELSRAAGDRVGLVRSLQYMAERNIASGDYAMALERLEEARPIVSREIDDATLACRVELTSATLWRHRGDLERAQSHVQTAVAWTGGLKGWRTSMDPYLTQAEVALDAGDIEGALSAISVSVHQAREANHPERLARALLVEAGVAAALGEVDAATDALTEAEKLWGEPNDPTVVALIRGARGRIALADSRPGEAATWFSEAADIAGAAGARLLSIENTEDLAVALSAADPADDRPAKLFAEASHERAVLGAPRPPARVAALAHVGS